MIRCGIIIISNHFFFGGIEMEKIWRDVVGYEEYYQVSSLGEIRNKNTGKILSQYKGNTGYMCLRLGKCNYKSKKLYLVHRLVAEAFLPNPHGFHYVSHKDETKTNNCAENLEWVEAKENNNMPQHKERISKGKKLISNKGKPRETPVLCDNIFYKNLTQFSLNFQLNPSTVWRWLNNKTTMPQEWKNRGLKYVK